MRRIRGSIEMKRQFNDGHCVRCGTYIDENYCTHCGADRAEVKYDVAKMLLDFIGNGKCALHIWGEGEIKSRQLIGAQEDVEPLFHRLNDKSLVQESDLELISEFVLVPEFE
jgi:hypothetical protein